MKGEYRTEPGGGQGPAGITRLLQPRVEALYSRSRAAIRHSFFEWRGPLPYRCEGRVIIFQIYNVMLFGSLLEGDEIGDGSSVR